MYTYDVTGVYKKPAVGREIYLDLTTIDWVVDRLADKPIL